MITFKKTMPCASQSDIISFEKKFHVRLPASYKSFLLGPNGGSPAERLVYPIEGMELNPYGGLQLLFGLNTGHEFLELEDDNSLYSRGVPSKLVLIGPSGSGDYVCLDLRHGDDRVVFWDKRHFWGTGEWRENDLYLVAPSFEAFLTSLKPLS